MDDYDAYEIFLQAQRDEWDKCERFDRAARNIAFGLALAASYWLGEHHEASGNCFFGVDDGAPTELRRAGLWKERV